MFRYFAPQGGQKFWNWMVITWISSFHNISHEICAYLLTFCYGILRYLCYLLKLLIISGGGDPPVPKVQILDCFKSRFISKILFSDDLCENTSNCPYLLVDCSVAHNYAPNYLETAATPLIHPYYWGSQPFPAHLERCGATVSYTHLTLPTKRKV